jgi:hypothetical protein
MGYFKKILNNCNEVSLLSLKGKEEALTLQQQFETKFHILFCKCCKNFNIQSDKIDQSLKVMFKDVDKHPPIKADDDFKSKLKDILNK